MKFIFWAGLACLFISNCTMLDTPTVIDYQGHRGCRGLLPENSIPAFFHALQYSAVTTLEMDVVISQDHQVVISHEPWMSTEICSLPQDGMLGGFVLPQVETVPYPGEPAEALVPIYQLHSIFVQSIICGSSPHPRFPDQFPLTTHKPLLSQLIDTLQHPMADAITGRDLSDLRFNIELKYTPEWEAAGLVPDMTTFCQLVLSAIEPLTQDEMRVSLQCFYPPLLALLKAMAPEIPLVYLDEFPDQGSLDDKFNSLGFVPEIYSPYYLTLTAPEVQKAHQLGAKVIPWTVNETTEMEKLVGWGVDGIITDYPNRIPE